MSKIRFLTVNLVLIILFACQLLEKPTPNTTVTEPVKISLPIPLSAGEPFTFTEKSTGEENTQKDGMKGKTSKVQFFDRTTLWKTRIVRLSPDRALIDYSSTQISKDGTTRDAVSSAEAKSIDQPREILMANLVPNFIISELLLDQVKSELHTEYEEHWNLIRIIESFFGGQTFDIGKEIKGLSQPLIVHLMRMPFRGSIEGFERERIDKVSIDVKCVLKGVEAQIALFEVNIIGALEGMLAKNTVRCKGWFQISTSSGRVKAIEIESSNSLKENRFYENISTTLTIRSLLEISADSPPQAIPYDLTIQNKPGDKQIVRRFFGLGSIESIEDVKSNGVNRSVQYAQEYFISENEPQFKRRYEKCETSYLNVDDLDGKSFVLKTRGTDLIRVEGDESLFNFVGRDDVLDTWVPKHRVNVGDCWTQTGPSTGTEVPKNFAVLLSVKPSQTTGRSEAHIGIFGALRYPWEKNTKANTKAIYLVIDLGTKKTVRRVIHYLEPVLSGMHYSVRPIYDYAEYIQVPQINWKAPTYREKKTSDIKTRLKQAKDQYKSGNRESALNAYSELGQELVNLPTTIFKVLISDLETFRNVLLAEFLGKEWKTLEMDAGEFVSKHPDRPEGYIYQSISRVNKRKFKDALTLLNTAMTKIKENAPDTNENKTLVNYWLAKVHLNLGDFGKAHSSLDAALETAKGAERSDVNQLLASVMEAEKMGIYIAFKEPDFLPLGTYHLMSERNGPFPTFINLHLINGSEEDKVIAFSAEVIDVTYTSIDQVFLPKRRQTKEGTTEAPFNMRIFQTPPLRKDFDVNSIIEDIERPIKIVVKEKTDNGDIILLERTIPVTIWPRTRLIYFRQDRDETGEFILTDKATAAWVTPRSPFVEQFIKDAKALLPKDVEFLGGAGISAFSAKDQVRAMYDFLKSRGVSYVGYMHYKDKGCLFQEVRLPAHVYKTSNSLCIEGTVLFASLMEGIGLKPILVFRPGHAFVGWHDPNGPIKSRFGTFYVLETTSLGRHNFEAALRFAENDFENWRPHLENPTQWHTQIMDIAELRKQGYKPQPYQD